MDVTKCDFSLEHYFEVLDNAKKKYAIGPLKNFTKLKQKKKFIILRHDVDMSLEQALYLAKKENEKGIRATYFILIQGSYYNALSRENVEIIKEIFHLDHEVGLHYDSNFAKSKIQLNWQIKKMAELLSNVIKEKITSIAQHNVVISPELNARDSSEYLDAMSSNVLINTTYIADSVQNWRSGCMCQHVGNEDHLYILTHPIWWSEKQFSRDKVLLNLEKEEINKIKRRLADSSNIQTNYIKNLKGEL